MDCFWSTIQMDINQLLLVHLNEIGVICLLGHQLIGTIPIGAGFIAKIFTSAAYLQTVPFAEIWRHSSPLVIFLLHHLLHVNQHMCKSVELLMTLEILHSVLANCPRLFKKRSCSTVVRTKDNFIGRTTWRTFSVMPPPYSVA